MIVLLDIENALKWLEKENQFRRWREGYKYHTYQFFDSHHWFNLYVPISHKKRIKYEIRCFGRNQNVAFEDLPIWFQIIYTKTKQQLHEQNGLRYQL